METQEIECCFHGSHVYQGNWEAAVDEELVWPLRLGKELLHRYRGPAESDKTRGATWK